MAAPRKILIVDPDPSVARSLAPALRQRGYQVHGARDGTRALQVAILRLPDLVLFDEATPLLDAAPSSASCGPTRAPSASRW